MARMSTETKQICVRCGSARSTKFPLHLILSRENELCRSYHETENFDTITASIIPKKQVIISRRSKPSAHQFPDLSIRSSKQPACRAGSIRRKLGIGVIATFKWFSPRYRHTGRIPLFQVLYSVHSSPSILKRKVEDNCGIASLYHASIGHIPCLYF